MEVTTLDYLLSADIENTTKSMTSLGGFYSKLPEAIESATTAFDRLNSAWGRVCSYDRHRAVVREWAKEHNVREEDALGLLRKGRIVGKSDATDSSVRAQSEVEKAGAIVARSYLTMRLGRDFLFGLTDLLRLRLTTSTGYFRLQSESCGLLKLMAQKPEVAGEWFACLTKRQGREFHRTWNSQVVHEIKELGLIDEYNEASEMALHSRPWGISRGVLIGGKSKKPNEIKLVYQEIDDVRILFLYMHRYLRFHLRILEKSALIHPELTDGNMEELSIGDFRQHEQDITQQGIQIRKAMEAEGVFKAFYGNADR